MFPQGRHLHRKMCECHKGQAEKGVSFIGKGKQMEKGKELSVVARLVSGLKQLLSQTFSRQGMGIWGACVSLCYG